MAAGDSIAEIETDKASFPPAEQLSCSRACLVPSYAACAVRRASACLHQLMHSSCPWCGHGQICLLSTVAALGAQCAGCAQATMDWESQDDGFIAKLLVEDGAKDLAVGDPVLVFVEDEVRKTAPSSCTDPQSCVSPP